MDEPKPDGDQDLFLTAEPGEEGATDIVGRTGEEMPLATHDQGHRRHEAVKQAPGVEPQALNAGDARVESCRWACMTVRLPYPLWLESEDKPWSCLRDPGPNPLESTDVCRGCPRWQPDRLHIGVV